MATLSQLKKKKNVATLSALNRIIYDLPYYGRLVSPLIARPNDN